jgi:hypothetical protein
VRNPPRIIRGAESAKPKNTRNFSRVFSESGCIWLDNAEESILRAVNLVEDTATAEAVDADDRKSATRNAPATKPLAAPPKPYTGRRGAGAARGGAGCSARRPDSPAAEPQSVSRGLTRDSRAGSDRATASSAAGAAAPNTGNSGRHPVDAGGRRRPDRWKSAARNIR